MTHNSLPPIHPTKPERSLVWHYTSVDEVQEQEAPLLGNGKENWGIHHIGENGIWYKEEEGGRERRNWKERRKEGRERKVENGDKEKEEKREEQGDDKLKSGKTNKKTGLKWWKWERMWRIE